MKSWQTLLPLIVATGLAGCGSNTAPPTHDDHDHEETTEELRGAHGGRLLTGKKIDLELQIIEEGIEPQYRAYLSSGGKSLTTNAAQVTVTLRRLGGRVQTLHLQPEDSYLISADAVYEPHSFDVTVDANINGSTEQWTFSSIEGRTEIATAFANRAGITVAKVQPGQIREQLRLHGSLELSSAGRSEVRARFPGLITSLQASVGKAVRRGEILAVIESNESLSRYSITAPIGGIIEVCAANVGEQTADRILFEIVDPNKIEAHLNAFAADLARLRPGQPVDIRFSSDGDPIVSRIAAAAPRVSDISQSVVMRVPLPSQANILRPGLAVMGDVLIANHAASRVVDVRALQTWRDMDVVFRRVGEIYEVQPIVLGRRDSRWAEVLSGIEAGAEYVLSQSYLVKADIEKSGAAHDH